MTTTSSSTRISKPWRLVYGVRGASSTTEHFRSQRATYDRVITVTRSGFKATVYHWEDGRWVKYEIIDAAETTR